jgi:hypothetical protein
MAYKQTDRVIAELVDATCGRQGDMRARHVLKQALHGLVRLAKVEQLTDMRVDVDRATATLTDPARQRATRALLRKVRIDVSTARHNLGALACEGCRITPGQPCGQC